MIREEEDDMTQEIRQLVMLQTRGELDKVIEKIEQIKVEVKDEYTEGFNVGLNLVVNFLERDKNAISISQT